MKAERDLKTTTERVIERKSQKKKRQKRGRKVEHQRCTGAARGNLKGRSPRDVPGKIIGKGKKGRREGCGVICCAAPGERNAK